MDGEAPVAGRVHERADGRLPVCRAPIRRMPGHSQTAAAALTGRAAAAAVEQRPTAAVRLEVLQDTLPSLHTS